MLQYNIYIEGTKKAILYYMNAGYIIDLYDGDVLVEMVDATGCSRQYAETRAIAWVQS